MSKPKTAGGIDDDYTLIPMNEITDEARKIAVRWGKNMKDDFILQKHKLASDIMNYARRFHASQSSSMFTREQVIEFSWKIFKAGVKNALLHLDDDSYDKVNFQEALKKHLPPSLTKGEK